MEGRVILPLLRLRQEATQFNLAERWTMLHFYP